MARKKDTGTTETSDLELVDLEKLLGGPQDSQGETSTPAGKPVNRRELADRLVSLATSFRERHTFQPGQLVRWKKGMRNRRTPVYGAPVVVIQILDEPVYDRDLKSGSMYFREPLTLVAGDIDKDGDFLTFHYDGRRFEPYKE